MQSRYTVHIMPSEWRWVIFVAIALVLIAFAPFLWVALSNTEEWQFMGMLHNYWDGGSYLAKMVQGMDGHWLIRFQHTPEEQSRIFIQVLYPLMGHVARFLSLSPILLFHVARVGASLFMYVALYQLAASIWMKIRTRRLFFLIVSVGSGFGWLLAPITGNPNFPDLIVPEAYPLFSTFANPHFPLTIACLALMASVFIIHFRPGANERDDLGGVMIVSVLSLMISLLYPQALLSIAGGFGLYVVIAWIQQRKLNGRMVPWLAALILPSLPMAAYYGVILAYNPAVVIWNQQNVTPAPSVPVLLLGFGVPLLLALPSLYRAVRRFEQDDDRFMLLWLLALLVLIYLPTNVQRRFAAGMMIPIAYFATRALEDVWFGYVNRHLRNLLLAVLIMVMAMSNVFSLLRPVWQITAGGPGNVTGTFLERDYAPMFTLVAIVTSPDDVVLASPLVSVWLPGWTGARVVYGHPYETLDANAKAQAVLDWYNSSDPETCAALLTTYRVRFILIGPEERKLGAAGCEPYLRHLFTIGQVGLYAPATS